MEIKRDVYLDLKKQMKRKEILALVGPRQVGKTTLMQELYWEVKEESTFLTFEDIETLQLFETNIKLFIERYVRPNKYLFIDEFQYAKAGGKSLKFIYDTEKIKICTSGSSNPDLAINSLQFLVGRVAVFEIFPLSFREFINYKDKGQMILFDKERKQDELKTLQNLFEEFLQYGGYPEVVLENDHKQKKTILKNIINTYLLKEVKEILDYKNLFEYENILKKLALQDGGILNKNSFCVDLGIKIRNLNQVLSVLNSTYIVNQVMPYYRNASKSLIKSPKTYFLDTGFKNALILNFNTLELKQDKGEILENFVYNELRKLEIKPYFWNYQNRHEMDFVIENEGKVTGIECKSKLLSSDITKSAARFIEIENPSNIITFNENMDGQKSSGDANITFTNYLNIYFVLKECTL